MKKLIALLLVLAMCLSLAACGETPASSTASSSSESSSTSSASEPAESSEVSETGTQGYQIPDTIDPVNDWGKYDDLIQQIRTTTDTAERTQLMHQAEDMLMETGAILPLYFYTDIYMQKEYLKNVYTTPFGYKYFMFSSLDNGSDTLRLYIASEPDKLDPALNSTVDGAILAINSFAGLMTYDESGKQVYDVAESHTVSEDGLTYTFTLRDGLKWSNGDPLDATTSFILGTVPLLLPLALTMATCLLPLRAMRK